MAGNFTKIFQKSQMPGGLPGGAWAVLELTGTLVFEFEGEGCHRTAKSQDN